MPRRAFTLLETMVVVVLTAVLAAAAVPAVRLMNDARAAAAAAEAARVFRIARASAGALGEPVGVRVDAQRGSLLPVVHAHGSAVPLPDAGGRGAAEVLLSKSFPGAGIEAFTIDGAPAEAHWFAPAGDAVALDALGRVAGPAGDARLRLLDGAEIRVHGASGMIEVVRP